MRYTSYVLCILFVNFFYYTTFGKNNCFTPVVGTILTFTQNTQTTSVKHNLISRSACDGDNNCKYSSDIEIVKCNYTGFDVFQNYKWVCKTDLHNLKLEEVFVLCENCSSFNLRYLKASCKLYYNLNYSINEYLVENRDDLDNDNNGNFKNFLIELVEILLIVIFLIMIPTGFVMIVACCVMYVEKNRKEYLHKYDRLPLRSESFREVEPMIINNVSDYQSASPSTYTQIHQGLVQHVCPNSYQNSHVCDNLIVVEGVLVN